jgi:hypothetical protein
LAARISPSHTRCNILTMLRNAWFISPMVSFLSATLPRRYSSYRIDNSEAGQACPIRQDMHYSPPSERPDPAVVVCITTDVLAYVPTVAHSWVFSFNEAWASSAWYAVSAAAALAAAAHLTATAVAYPALLVLAETVTAAVILTRRRMTAPPPGLVRELPARRKSMPPPQSRK